MVFLLIHVIFNSSVFSVMQKIPDMFQKLRIFTKEDGTLISMEKTLENVIKEEVIFNGSSVILEYVDNDVQFLQDPEKYQLWNN